MRILVLTAVLLLTGLASSAQSHTLHVNANYLLTQRPVFGFGYAFAPDSSRTTFGMSFEFGRFSFQETGILSSAVDQYEESGIGLRPEVRQYFGKQAFQQKGLFATVFANYRMFYANHSQGKVTESGALEYPYTDSRMGRMLRVGGQLGYRLGCGADGILVECAAGGGMVLVAHNGEAAPFFQLDLNLAGVFQRLQSQVEEDYVLPAH